MTDIDARVPPPLVSTYEDQKRLAHDGNYEERRELAGRADARPEILYYLASDPDTEVRRQIARNLTTPRHADLLLANDEKEEVRTDVATKIAQFTARMAEGEQSNVYRLTMEALEILARDQLVRVRRILSETLKNSSVVPINVVQRLARDCEISVAQPILEHSPLLSDELLIEVLKSEPVQGALSAIARRVALGEQVADAIVHTGDVDAIAELLGNESAQIREETLDRIVDQAPRHVTWHKPLVHRPNLHFEAAKRIAEIVAVPLLEDLKRRTDLDDTTIEAIREITLRRVEAGDRQVSAETRPDAKAAPARGQPPAAAQGYWQTGRPTGGDAKASEGPRQSKAESPVARRVREMFAAGELDEHEISSALNSGGREFVTTAIALLSKTPIDTVSRAVSMRSTKAIIALCWKAGLTMRLATRLQMQLAGIPPGEVLRATESGDFPMTPEDMRWQLEFISSLKMRG